MVLMFRRVLSAVTVLSKIATEFARLRAYAARVVTRAIGAVCPAAVTKAVQSGKLRENRMLVASVATPNAALPRDCVRLDALHVLLINCVPNSQPFGEGELELRNARVDTLAERAPNPSPPQEGKLRLRLRSLPSPRHNGGGYSGTAGRAERRHTEIRGFVSLRA